MSKITNGRDGALWYVNRGTNKLGRITTSGVITETAFPTSNAVTNGIAGITTGGDSAVYVAESNTNQVARVSTPVPDRDFNGDGRADILWSNSVTGNVAMWLMNGGTVLSSLGFGNLSPWTGREAQRWHDDTLAGRA